MRSFENPKYGMTPGTSYLTGQIGVLAAPVQEWTLRISVLDRLADDNKHFLRYALGSLAECDTQLIIAESLGYGEYSKQLKATMMSLTMGIRAYGKSLAQP